MLQVYNKYGQIKVVSSTSSSGVSSVSGVSPITSTGGSNPIISTLVTPNKLLGRYSPSTGPMQEIIIGTGLSLVGNTLNSTSVVTANALTRVNDTNVTLTLGGTPVTALLQNVSLTLGWTGTLADSRITSATNWNTAYTNRITSLTTTGSGAATLIANVLNIPTPPATTFTSLTVTGDSGPSTLLSGVLNVPTYSLSGLGGQPLSTNLTSLSTLTYASLGFVKMSAAGTFTLDTSTYLTGITSLDVTTALGYTPVTNARTLTINGVTYDLTADRSWTIATSPLTTKGDLYTFSTIDARLPVGTNTQILSVDSAEPTGLKWINVPATGVTSVGLTMPPAFSVTNSPITSSGDIAVTGAGLVSQYVRGDGTLANFPNSTGGGSSVNYYLNGSVSQGTFGGDVYYQLSKTPVFGAGTGFTRTQGQGNGYIASFITNAGDPSFLNIPAGNWNLEFYFSASANGSNPRFYGELYKVSASNVFTLIASGSANPEGITNGTTVDQYFTSISVPQTTLLITDRIAIRVYVIPNARNITLHTENSNLSEVITTFTTGLTALNGLTQQVQNLAVGTSGTDFAISSVTDTHTFNLPTASASNRGALSSTDWSTFNNKQNASTRRNANNSTNSNINYCGVALGTGVSDTASVWTIKRLTITAQGVSTATTATNVRWVDRETAIYT